MLEDTNELNGLDAPNVGYSSRITQYETDCNNNQNKAERRAIMRTTTRMLSDDPIMLRILEHIKLQGKTEKEVEQSIGLTTGAFTRWKYTKSKSYMGYLKQIANCLNLTPEYLLDVEDRVVNQHSLTESETRLLKMFRKLDIDKQQCLLKTTEIFLEAEGKQEFIEKKYNINRDCIEKNTIVVMKKQRK